MLDLAYVLSLQGTISDERVRDLNWGPIDCDLKALTDAPQS